MNAKHISDALEQLDDGLLDGANALRGSAKRRANRPKWIGAAACLVVAVCAGAGLLYTGRDLPQTDVADLPKLPLSEEVSHPNGMGYEGYLAYDVSELISGSPWQETDNLQTLPVYRNPVICDQAGAPVDGIDLDAMEARALEVAGRLGVDAEIQDNAPTEEEIAAVQEKLGEIPEGYFDPVEVNALGDGVEITVGANLTAEILFDPALALPEGYNFNYHAPYEDMKAVSDYLLGQYGALLAMDDPQIEPTGGGYTYSGEQMYEITACDRTGGETQRLLSYSFNRASFSCDEEGRLWIIRLEGMDLSQKVGDYPVITPEAAKKLLVGGKYITNVPHELPGAEYVKGVELLYLTGRQEQYFMPYYRFLVELPQAARENGLHTYGAYYVPAVEEAYLTGLPVWSGSFN